jgi:hypothetical protein
VREDVEQVRAIRQQIKDAQSRSTPCPGTESKH